LISCIAIGLPAGATSFTSPSNTYYVGVEDTGVGGPLSGTSDYDYNDLIFSLTGSSPVTLDGDAGAVLYAPFNVPPPSTAPPPFWNNNSYDNNPSTPYGLNFGQCMYSTPNSCGGPFEPTASYLAENNAGQTSSNFWFTSTGGTITLNLLANITNNTNDITSLMYCTDGSTTGCTAIAFTGGVATFAAPSGNFDLVLNLSGTGGGFYDSNTLSTGAFSVSDPSFDHFAVAVGTPVPGTLAVVGSVLVGLGVLRRRHSRKR